MAAPLIRSDRRPKGRIPLAVALSAAIGGLLLVAVATVYVSALTVAVETTTSLIADRARLAVTMLRARVREYLQPAEALVAFLASRIQEGKLSAGDDAELRAALTYTLAAAPQLGAAAWLSRDGWALAASRAEDGRIIIRRIGWRARPHLRLAITGLERRREVGGVWSRPLFIAERGRTVVTYARPVYRDGRFEAALVAVLPVAAFSRFLRELSSELRGRAFVLYGREIVLAHPGVRFARFTPSPEHPLPRIDELGDPALAAIWTEDRSRSGLNFDLPGHSRVLAGIGRVFYLYARLEEGRETPWIVGVHFRAADMLGEARRLRTAALAGLAFLLLAVVAGIVVARRLARPVIRFAEASRHLARLEFEAIPEPRPSRIRELHEAAQAFAGMVAALRAFARYVPRELVRRLLRTGRGQAPQRRRLTVMFTDLAGFTGLAERLDTARTAGFVEGHFAMLTRCIEHTGGTVDKLMGDGVMAFWGAPEPVSDHGLRAIRAARAIAEAHLARRGEPDFLPLRIGIHSGEVIVGEIVTPSKATYTVLGDAVNTAARLEQLARELEPRPAVAILVSEETLEGLGDRSGFVALGERRLRGRRHPLRVHALLYA